MTAPGCSGGSHETPVDGSCPCGTVTRIPAGGRIPLEEFTQDQAARLTRIACTPPAMESFRHRPSCPGVVDGDCPCPPSVVRAL